MLRHVKNSKTGTAFGSLMPQRFQSAAKYRFGWNNGSEKDDEITGVEGTHIATFFREYDTRLGRTWSLDPVFQPWQSSYSSMDNNPIWFNDPMGDIVDGDKEGKENYKNYRKENNARVTSLQGKMKGLDESFVEYANLNKQLQSYQQINTELDALEADQKNLYYINSNVTFGESSGDGQTEGQAYFKGMTTYEGKEMKQINIDLTKKMFPMSTMAHEFKHAYQYYEGRLIFIAGTQGGFNSQEFEHEAFERGGRFSGNLQTNNNRFKINYTYEPVFRTQNYKDMVPKVTKEQVYWYAKKKGLELIENKP